MQVRTGATGRTACRGGVVSGERVIPPGRPALPGVQPHHRAPRAGGRGASKSDVDLEALAEWLYERSGGVFWRGETTWQDRHRDEARQWFAYADLIERVRVAEAKVARVETYVARWLDGDENALPPEAFNVLDDLRAALASEAAL